MSKISMYFKSEAAMNDYFKDGVPSNVLAIVEGESNDILFSSSNNGNNNGVSKAQGGYITSPEDEARIDALEEGKADKINVYTKAEVDNMIDSVEVDLTDYATKNYVDTTIDNVIGAAPAALDTLKEIGDALNNDSDFAGTMTAALATKADKSELNSYVSISSLESMSYATQTYVADYVSTYGGGSGSSVQSDWNENDSTAGSYILNKPSIKAGQNGSVLIGSAMASGVNSFSHGDSTSAAGSRSHAEGQFTWSVGAFSHAEGINTVTHNVGEHAEGYYNKSTKTSNTFGNSGNTLHSVGIGTSESDRKNAIEIMENGNIYAYGVGNYDGTNFTNASTLAYVINDIQAQVGSAAALAETIVGSN